MRICSGGGDEGIPGLRGQPDDAQHPPVWEPPQWCLESSQELAQRYETESAWKSRETWEEMSLSASQCQPGPLAAGIRFSIEERLCLPSACLVRLVLQPHRSGQPLSQDTSLFPRHTITSLFLPVLKHTVLASVCNLKCQVPSLWHHKGVSYP